MGIPLVIPFAKKPLCALVLLSPVTQGGEGVKLGKRMEPGAVCRRVVEVLGGIKVSPVNGACAHPKLVAGTRGVWISWRRMSPFRLEHLEAGLLESPHGVV